MIKKIPLFLMLLASFGIANAGPVPLSKARQVASNFVQQKGLKIDQKGGWNDLSSETPFEEFYILSGPGGKGFVLVSKDDRVIPILAYSESNTFETNDMPENIIAWLSDYDNQIRFNRENDIAPSPQTTAKWEELEKGAAKTSADVADEVPPLLSTTWSQSPRYNRYCPWHGTTQTPTGCVATAMAQIMKYWNWPPINRGAMEYTYSSAASENYDNQAYSSTLSSNFADTVFDWENMPNSLTSSSTETEINAVASLMYNVGISVNMSYGTRGSGAVTCVNSNYQFLDNPTQESYATTEVALRNYFHYKYTTNAVFSSDFTNSEWIEMLKMELNAGRPVLYAGQSQSGGGHAFVLDGYNSNNYFHVNWGWGGTANGDYAIGALNPFGSGTGASSSNQYNYSNKAVIGIEPAATIEPEDGTTTVTALSLQPSMGSVTGGGTYPNYSGVFILTATPNSGYRFLQWTDGNRDNPRYQKATGGTQIYTAVFTSTTGNSSAYKYFYNEGDPYFSYYYPNSNIPEWGIQLPYSMLADADYLDKVIFLIASDDNAPSDYVVKVYYGWPGHLDGYAPAYTSPTLTYSAGIFKFDSITLSSPLPIRHTDGGWNMYITLTSSNGGRCFKDGSCPSAAHWDYYNSQSDWVTRTSFPYCIKAHCQSSNLPAPTDLAVNNVSANGAQLSWNAPAASLSPTSYVVAYGQGIVPDAMEQQVVTNNTITLSNLANNTRYYVFVKARYRNNLASSEWVRVSFRTRDNTITNPVEVTVLANEEDWGTVSGSGVYAGGSNVTISATAMPRFQFTGWQDGNTESTRTIVPSSDATYTAYFEPIGFSFEGLSDASFGTVQVEGEDSWTIGSTTYYPYLSTVCLTATPAAAFRHWDDGNTTNPRYCTVTGNTVLTAHFDASGSKVSVSGDQRSLSVSVVEAAPIAVYDMLGRCVFRTEATPGTPTHVALSNAGVYLVRIGTGYAEKVVVR